MSDSSSVGSVAQAFLRAGPRWRVKRPRSGSVRYARNLDHGDYSTRHAQGTLEEIIPFDSEMPQISI